MATNLSIGLYHPSEKLPIDIAQLGFVTASQHCYSQKIAEFYPGINLPIRSYLVGETQFKEERDFIKKITSPAGQLKEYSLQNKVQLVFNELFNATGNLKPGITDAKIITYIDLTLRAFSNVEIIFNEMNTYRITHYTGNGFQDNGVLQLIKKVQDRFPMLKLSLGVQTIGNKLCKDLILKSLPIVLSHVKNLDWFVWPIHFTEVGYYHDPYSHQQQTKFLDEIKSIAESYGVASLCYIYPWDGDYFHLAGQPRNAICGIWDEDWNVKYDIFA
jgi:hypothetical protein